MYDVGVGSNNKRTWPVSRVRLLLMSTECKTEQCRVTGEFSHDAAGLLHRIAQSIGENQPVVTLRSSFADVKASTSNLLDPNRPDLYLQWVWTSCTRNRRPVRMRWTSTIERCMHKKAIEMTRRQTSLYKSWADSPSDFNIRVFDNIAKAMSLRLGEFIDRLQM